MKNWIGSFLAAALGSGVAGLCVLSVALLHWEKVNEWEAAAASNAQWIGNSFSLLNRKMEPGRGSSASEIKEQLEHSTLAVNSSRALLTKRPLGAVDRSNLKELVEKANRSLEEVKQMQGEPAAP